MMSDTEAALHTDLSGAEDRLAAVRLALEFSGLTQPEDILKVIGRLVRDAPVDTTATEPTRLLVEAIRIERPYRANA